jgi:hypothetical protein
MGQAVGGDAAFDAADALGFTTVLRILLSHVFRKPFCGLTLSGEANRQSQRTGQRPTRIAAIIPRLRRLGYRYNRNGSDSPVGERPTIRSIDVAADVPEGGTRRGFRGTDKLSTATVDKTVDRRWMFGER